LAVAHAGIGIPGTPSPQAKAGCQWDIGQGINVAVHKTASPETFRDWRID
jgi:hypothetical protein